MEDHGIIDDAMTLIEKLRDSDSALIKFIKKDGSTRLMKCTLNFERIPLSDKPKNINVPAIYKNIKNHKQINVYDIEKKGWRRINVDTSEWIEFKKNDPDDKSKPQDVIRYRLRIK